MWRPRNGGGAESASFKRRRRARTQDDGTWLFFDGEPLACVCPPLYGGLNAQQVLLGSRHSSADILAMQQSDDPAHQLAQWAAG
jgi:hypothetical protein